VIKVLDTARLKLPRDAGLKADGKADAAAKKFFQSNLPQSGSFLL
jgi:hypothetical protein